MMKAYKFGMFIVSVGLIFGLVTGCGGGGTDAAPLTVINDGGVSDTPSVSTIEEILEKENKQADEFVSQRIAYTDALNEYMAILDEVEISEIDLENMSLDEFVNYVGEDKAVSLGNQLEIISNEKIEPALTAAIQAHRDILISEQQIKEIKLSTFQPSIAKDFLINKHLKDENPEVAVAFTTGTCALIAAGILLPSMATGLDCGLDVLGATDECVAAEMDKVSSLDKFPGIKKASAFLKCAKAKYPPEIWECLKAVATTTATTVGSIAATGYKPIQFTIDYISGLDLGLTIKNILGKDCGSVEGPKPLTTTDAIYEKDIGLNPDATIYIGKGENGKFLVPEGQWSFVTFADGAARQVTECINVFGDEDIINHNVTMMTIDEFEDQDCDDMNIQVSIPGYTGPFVSNHTEMSFASMDDGPYIFPSFITTDANSPEEFDPLTSNDVFIMIFNTTLSAGQTYPLNDEFEFGNAEVSFATPQIVDENGMPIAFTPVSGSFTLTEYGTNVGDRLSGSFNCDVIGKRSEDVVINGTISGTFSGTLTASQLDSAISKSMKISF